MGLGPLDSQQNHVAYWLHYEKEVPNAQEIVRLLLDKSQMSELLNSGDTKLENLFKGGPRLAYH